MQQMAAVSCMDECPADKENLGTDSSDEMMHEADNGGLQQQLNHSQMLENLIMSATYTSTEQAARSGNRTGEMKQCVDSSIAACEDIEKEALAALRHATLNIGGREVGASGLKRAAATCMSPSVDVCPASMVTSKNMESSARVRARRGEATDKHSISERTRRTKISDRMRALHKLIPDASKTNKASMLDEVIQHVSMLQARLKVECMKKLDGRGDANAPLSMDKEGWRRSCNRIYVNRMIEKVLDPLEDRLAEAERQVMTRLAHPSHDISLATAYLSSAGLTLVPISHLSSISNATKKQHS
ncbi:hypothetical protein GOP47_0026370 [Adiantum capillus-veneris]|nr:hypothetical protein GOP47_0026370 [Adiantum capillus-veneris]